MIDAVGRLDQTQEFGIWARASRGRYREKKPAEPGNRNITRIACHRHRATATIDDRRIKNAAVLNSQGITPRRPNLRSRRAIANVVHLVLVDAISTDHGGAGATRRREITPWAPNMRPAPISAAVPDPIPHRDGLGRDLGWITVFAGYNPVSVQREDCCMFVS